MSTSNSLVVDCPECHRTIWANTKCAHGQVVLTKVKVDQGNAELFEPDEPRPSKQPRHRRDKGH
jgi:hypothetical protein